METWRLIISALWPLRESLSSSVITESNCPYLKHLCAAVSLRQAGWRGNVMWVGWWWWLLVLISLKGEIEKLRELLLCPVSVLQLHISALWTPVWGFGLVCADQDFVVLKQYSWVEGNHFTSISCFTLRGIYNGCTHHYISTIHGCPSTFVTDKSMYFIFSTQKQHSDGSQHPSLSLYIFTSTIDCLWFKWGV